MRAGDLTPGRYYAHGATYVNCEILSVTHDPERNRVRIDHTYMGEHMDKWYDEDRDWKVKHADIEIAEEPEWVDLLWAN